MWYYAEYTYIWGISTSSELLSVLCRKLFCNTQLLLWILSVTRNLPPLEPTHPIWEVITFRKCFLKTSTNLLLLSCSVMSDSLQPYGLQHARLPCPSLSPRVYSNSCPSSLWCLLTISSSSALSSFAFNFSQHQGLFQWLSSSHQVPKFWSFSFSMNPSNEYSGLIPLGLTGLISLQSKGLSRVF